MADIKQIKVGNTAYDIDAKTLEGQSGAYYLNYNNLSNKPEFAKPEQGIYYIVGTGTTAGTWTGSHDDITEYYDGLTIAYRTNIAGASTTTLNINGLGAKTCYLRATTKVTTHYGVDTVVIFTYITVSGTGRWVTADYDANSYAYVRQYVETANSELPIVMSHDTEIPSSYKTKYTGVVSGVTLNPSTKTISATAFKENGTALADKYVAKVSGKGLSTNDYTTAEKNKLDGLSNYTLPAATSNTLGGVKTGTNITNSSGTISVTSTNVTDALGYTPASSTDLANKADAYSIVGEGELRGIQVGDDLSGKTVYFDTTKDYKVWNVTLITVATTKSNYFISTSISPPAMGVNGTEVYNVTSGGWLRDSLVLPSDAGTITSIQGAAGDVIKIQAGGEEITVDCEYNYNEIQALKRTINNSSGGSGLYKHNVKIDTGASYFIYVDVYTSSNTPITTASQLFEILGTNYTAGSHNGMDGYGAITFYFNSAGTKINVYGAIVSGSTVKSVNLSNQTVSKCTDTVKQV